MHAWIALSLLVLPLFMEQGSPRALFNSLDPTSVAQALAFFSVYPEQEEGKKALLRAQSLLKAPTQESVLVLAPLINRLKSEGDLTDTQMDTIEKLCAHFPNRKLKGYCVPSEAEVWELPAEEIDLGRALILSQFGEDPQAAQKARSYCALIDLMSLQILSQLPENPTSLDKIQATNHLIFDLMHFRFPPHSVYAQQIDLYTFLPSVMDNHLGVCLGVTALYLAIAQRIDLPFDIVTPPGHIYVRSPLEGNTHINIETTARGVHLPDETYLSLENKDLQLRTLKEVVGMTHVNQASTYLYKGEYDKAVQAYEKGVPYMPQDPLIRELLGYSYLFTDKKNEGEKLLKELEETSHSMAEDYLMGKVDLEGMASVLMLVDETRDSILRKQKRLLNVLEKYPHFRDGLHQLAVTWIQLNRYREAIDVLTRSYTIDPTDVTTAYYLAVLYHDRRDYKNCWKFLHAAEEITQKENFHPKVLRDLRRELTLLCPEPL